SPFDSSPVAEFRLGERSIEIAANALALGSVGSGRHHPNLLDARPIADQEADVSRTVRPGGFRPNPRSGASAAGVDRSGDHLFYVWVVGGESDHVPPFPATHQRRVASAEFVAWRCLDHRESWFPTAFAYCRYRVLAGVGNSPEVIVEVSAHRRKHLAVAGGIDFLGSFAVDLVRESPDEVPPFALFVDSFLFDRRHRPRPDALAVEKAGEARALAAHLADHGVGVRGLTRQTEVAGTVERPATPPTVHTRTRPSRAISRSFQPSSTGSVLRYSRSNTVAYEPFGRRKSKVRGSFSTVSPVRTEIARRVPVE